MLKQYGLTFVKLTKIQTTLARILEETAEQRGGDRSEVLPKMSPQSGLFKFVSEWLADCEEVSRDIGLKSVLAQTERIRKILERDTTQGEFEGSVKELGNRLEDDLKDIVFLHVSDALVPYYRDLQLFGPEVHDNFPSAIDDIEGAGKCLAVGQGTATVLHLMRVMEVGLKSLSRALGIPYAPSWESHLRQINDRISAQRKHKGIKWKRDEPFFRDVAGDLQIVKFSWRNPTMHVVRKYGPDEAEEIFRAVRSFMKRLAGRLSE